MSELTATADVATEAPARYAKQLAAHLGRETPGRRSAVTEEAAGTRITLAGGSCLLESLEGTLKLTATAPSQDVLERVTHVVGSHLERFGQRNELQVSWQPAA